MNIDDLSEWLASWRNFQECILRDVRSTDGMCTVDIVFAYIWKDRAGDDWSVGDDPDQPWPLPTVRLLGVSSIRYESDLWITWKDPPPEIGSGFAEISLVEVRPVGDSIEFAVMWEKGRELAVVAASADVQE